MIAYDSIKTRKGLFPDGNWKVEANCGIKTEKMVSKEQFDEVPKVLEFASDECRHDTWNFIYGDLFDPIKELQHYAIRNALPGDELRVQAICDKLNKLLRLP